MAYTTDQKTLVDRTRRYLLDTPDYDTITAAFSDTTGTTMTVADTTIYAKRWAVEVDQETMQIRSITNATTMVVERGAFGSTAATHTINTKVLVRPAFYYQTIADAVNQALMAFYPLVYLPCVDESLTTTDSTYEYSLPNLATAYSGNTVQMRGVYKVQLKYAGDLTFRDVSRWQIVRGPNGSRKLKFRSPEPGGATIRIMGFAPFPMLSSPSTVLDPSFPPQAEGILPMMAAGFVLQYGEAGRVRNDAGAIDSREQANRTGSSMSAGIALVNQAYKLLRDSGAMPPLPKHVKALI